MKNNVHAEVVAGWPLSEQIAYAEKNLDRVLQWGSKVDTKISVVLGMHTGMLGVAVSLAPEPEKWRWWAVVAFATTIGMLATGFTFIHCANYPRTRGPSKSLLFFGSIAGNSFNEFSQCWSCRTTDQHLQDLLEQCHRNSEIINNKFKYLKRAYTAMMFAILPWAITVLAFKWSK